MSLLAHWKLEAVAGGLVDDTGNLSPGTFHNAPSVVTGLDGNAVDFDGVNQYASVAAAGQLNGVTAWSVSLNIKAGQAVTNTQSIWHWFIDAFKGIQISQNPTGELKVWVLSGAIGPSGKNTQCETDAAVDLTNWRLFTVTCNQTTNDITLYVDGQAVAHTQTGDVMASASETGTASYFLATVGTLSTYCDVSLDDVRVYDHVLNAAEVAALWFGVTVIPAASLPASLAGFETSAASSLPLTLKNQTVYAAASLGLNLEGSDPSHYLGTVARWGLVVELEGVDISSQVAGACEIEAEEDASGLAALVIAPGAGAISPAAYERKHIAISFAGLDAAGAELYRLRLYTGITTAAIYDPDEGVIEIEATTDYQGRLENMPREVINSELGGTWSPHVFDDSADGYQYARDSLSTIASEAHIDNYGRLVVVPYAAGVAALTLTDGGRFANTLALTRAHRRDLVTRVRVNFDFRFPRLRHREVTVRFSGQGLCHYLDLGYSAPQKNAVTQAADGTSWTRVTPITFIDLPGPGTYCQPPRGYNGQGEDFCLGATWRAGRRWVQTVTEQNAIDVIAPDLEESIGRQEINADYGLEATYDSNDYERITEFDGPPTGSVYKSETNDYQIDGDGADYDGRQALELAQEVAINRARSLILARARGNRLALSPLFRPDITLEKTVRVQTPHLDATGKVAAYRQTLDPTTGRLDMRLELALSRHDGAGLAVNDPVQAPTPPPQEPETPTDRDYVIGFNIGGLVGSPVDSDDLEGQCTNVNPNVQTGPNLLRERFAIAMPEIEAAARDAVVASQVVEVELAVPDDPLTMSN